MVAEPTGPRSKADPKGQCSDGPGAAQVEELHNGRAGYPRDDGGLDGFLVTSFTPPIEVFKCQTHSERPGGRTFVHPVCLAILTPFTLSPCIQLVYGFRMIQTTLMGQFVLLHLDSSQRKFQTSALLRGTHFCRIFFCSSWDVCFIYRVLLFSYVFMLIKLCMLDLPTFTISNPNFTSGRLHLLCWIDDILDTENSFKCNRINSCWPVFLDVEILAFIFISMFNFYQRCLSLFYSKTLQHVFPLFLIFSSSSSQCVFSLFPPLRSKSPLQSLEPSLELEPPVMPQEAANMYITTYIYIMCVCSSCP